jgi:hypothetical protein
MMKQKLLAGVLVATLALAGGLVSAQTAQNAGTVLGTVNIPQRVMANGQALPAGTYQVRLAADMPKPAVGQTPEASRYVEFVRGGAVAGREVATVVSAAEVGSIAKGPRPANGSSRTELLRGGDYLRIWINQGGMNYLIHLPPA